MFCRNLKIKSFFSRNLQQYRIELWFGWAMAKLFLIKSTMTDYPSTGGRKKYVTLFFSYSLSVFIGLFHNFFFMHTFLHCATIIFAFLFTEKKNNILFEKILFRNKICFSQKIDDFAFPSHSLSFHFFSILNILLFFLEENFLLFLMIFAEKIWENPNTKTLTTTSQEKLENTFFFFYYFDFSPHNIQKTHPTRVLIHGDEVDEWTIMIL